MSLHEINSGIESNQTRKRLGRGTGSGLGKTSGRGHKGQRSRSGSSLHPLFEGGQMPLARRIPKRGFNNREFADVVATVNVSDLEANFESGSTVALFDYESCSLISGAYDKVKILGDGELTKNLTVCADMFSASALKKIQAVGGTVEYFPQKRPVVKNKMGTRKKMLDAKFGVKKK